MQGLLHAIIQMRPQDPYQFLLEQLTSVLPPEQEKPCLYETPLPQAKQVETEMVCKAPLQEKEPSQPAENSVAQATQKEVLDPTSTGEEAVTQLADVEEATAVETEVDAEKGVPPCPDDASVEVQAQEMETCKPEGDGKSVQGDECKVFGGHSLAVEPDVHQLKLHARTTLATALSSGRLQDAIQSMKMASEPVEESTHENAVEPENALRAMPSDCSQDAIKFVQNESVDVKAMEIERARQRAHDAIVIAVEKNDFERVLRNALGKSGDPVEEPIGTAQETSHIPEVAPPPVEEVPPVQEMTSEEDVVNEFAKEVPQSLDSDNEPGSKEDQRPASPLFSDTKIAALKLKVQEALLCGCESGALTAALETVSSRPPSRKCHRGVSDPAAKRVDSPIPPHQLDPPSMDVAISTKEESQSRPPSRKGGGGQQFQNEETISEQQKEASAFTVQQISDMSKKFEILQNDNAELKCQLNQMTQMMMELRDACQLNAQKPK